MSKTILIVGASRGIGLGLAREFKSRGWDVIATERSTSDELHALDDVRIETMDVTKSETFEGFDTKVDAVIVNAGITGAKHQSAVEATADEVAEVMMTNAFGPVHLAKTVLPHISDGGTLAFMTSLMGSIEDSSGGFELYRTSKAALNMLAKGVSEQDAGPRAIATLALHPGWVQTDMGGPNAKITVDESVKGLADVVEGAAGKSGFRYVDYTGKDLPY
ncbi:SDR family NAD(P)-dependent oxidoreductase [Qipengyuania seohaensis]|uniref:SDR family NAD(P)-dependent oxidoreductase n=1 Tax=Qipengyuania seohaensis TaxID=266951 RepID=UPI000C22401B|nr:SDR family NAD(P)-dependent oxidoreductase [Qipengyuania seohaensis]